MLCSKKRRNSSLCDVCGRFICVKSKGGPGFTFIEIIIVVVILSITALIAIPMMGSAAGIQMKAAANTVAADLEYAKNLAIARSQRYGVVFDVDSESYSVIDSSGNVVEHPVRVGKDYVVNFAQDGSFDKVGILNVNLNGTDTVKFDYLGSPYDESGNPINTGVITLAAVGETITINIEPVTGFISISN